ncbi:MAG TPA: hypothetical protein VNL71_10075 [Chloroflexota bacterium]|nr:hypothetical protein [Chloroflexota bacterium]
MARFHPSRFILAAAVAILGLVPAAGSHGASPQVVVLPSPMALDSLLATTLRPPRNLYAITERLKLHATTPINPYVNPTPTSYPVGHSDTFYVANDGNNGYMTERAAIAYETAHVYYYVQSGVHIDMAALIRSATTFENHSYPTDHAAFGAEWTPGVDNDVHITVFNGNVPGVGGYFSAEDLYPRVVNPYSNQRKIIYINLGAESPGTTGYDSVMAHEFQHMIHFHMHPADEAWINEGSSVLAQVLNGYSADGLDEDKASSPDTQLDTFDYANFGPYYGGGYLWLLYLYEQYGGTRATRAILTDSGLSNMALFDDVLAKLGANLTANQVFANWLVANFLNDRHLDGGRYGYVHSSIHSGATASVALPFSLHPTMHQYAGNYVDVANPGGKAFTLSFTGQTTVPLLGTVAPPQGFWWSNRGDSVDTTLTLPPLDLRGLSHATLNYSLWYDLERDYDYGYVEISTDGGATWYAQRTAHTTSTNPNGANIGNGYTGNSCSIHTTAQHCWVQESLDLSPYAGKQILARFEQVTDDEVNLQGMAIAHLQVPQIGFDGDSTPNGWQTAGWVRGGNTLAEHWLVQAIVYRPGGIQVVPMPVGAAGTGALTIPAGAGRVVVVVAPVAPLTTVTNTYTLSGGS